MGPSQGQTGRKGDQDLRVPIASCRRRYGHQLDQGLVFVAFNQDPSRQFAVVQNRLNNEPMIDYITPVGGGYFFAPPGARNASDWVGSGLFAE